MKAPWRLYRGKAIEAKVFRANVYFSKEAEMSIAGNSVGIDYHDQSLQVHVMSGTGQVVGMRRCKNSVGDVASFIARYGSVSGVAIEACTGSASFADALRIETGWTVRLCHPGYVQRMRHNPDKSDCSDAFLLSDLNRVGYLPEVWLAPEWIRDLRSLVRYRRQIVDQRKQVKLRIRSILRLYRLKAPVTIKNIWMRGGLSWLRSLRGLPEHTQWLFQRQLDDLDQLNVAIKEISKRLESVVLKDVLASELLKRKGIGVYTAAVLRAEIGTFTRFSRGKQLSRFCAVSPRNCSSGERQADAGLVKAGSSLLKTAVIEVAHSLVRHDSHWRNFAIKLRSQGKPYGVIVGAVANRWLRKLYHEMIGFEQQMAA